MTEQNCAGPPSDTRLVTDNTRRSVSTYNDRTELRWATERVRDECIAWQSDVTQVSKTRQQAFLNTHTQTYRHTGRDTYRHITDKHADRHITDKREDAPGGHITDKREDAQADTSPTNAKTRRHITDKRTDVQTDTSPTNAQTRRQTHHWQTRRHH